MDKKTKNELEEIMYAQQTNEEKVIKLEGNWTEGYALDIHTIHSTPIQENITKKIKLAGKEKEITTFGEITGWDTKYTPLGEDLNKLKYWKEKEKATTLSNNASTFIKSKDDWKIDLIIPIPPSDLSRNFQPVYEIARKISEICKLDLNTDILKKIKQTSELKSIVDPTERQKILENAFDIEENILKDKVILLFDDLYRSGETLKAVCNVLNNKGKAKTIFVLTITKTRSKR